jgi:hypothetical protein
MLPHVTRSRGWNITERVNGNVGNEIELGMVIPTIKSRILQLLQKKGIGHQCLRFNDKKTFMNTQGSLGISRSHW